MLWAASSVPVYPTGHIFNKPCTETVWLLFSERHSFTDDLTKGAVAVLWHL